MLCPPVLCVVISSPLWCTPSPSWCTPHLLWCAPSHWCALLLSPLLLFLAPSSPALYLTVIIIPLLEGLRTFASQLFTFSDLCLLPPKHTFLLKTRFELKPPHPLHHLGQDSHSVRVHARCGILSVSLGQFWGMTQVDGR